MSVKRTSRRKRRHPRRDDLKDRLIQTRVPESLESKLKKEASRRRLSVSHLIRNVLEDTFDLVDGVVAEVDTIVQDSLGLAGRVRRDAGRIARSAVGHVRAPEAAKGDLVDRNGETDQANGDHDREDAGARGAGATANRAEGTGGEARTPAGSRDESSLDHILAWNAVVMNRDGACARCGVALPRGGPGHLGISQDPGAAPTWLCGKCVSSL